MEPARQKPTFLSGVRVAALYYLAAALVVAICRAVPPLWDGVFIFLVFLPSVLLIGSLWGATTLVRFRRPSAWGALAVHAVAVPLIWWFTVPKVG